MEHPFPSLEVQRTRISDQITNVLKKAILEGKLKPGDKLPPEESIASRFKVSKVAVREALRQMETEGLIEKHRGAFGGSYVLEPDLRKIGDSVLSCYQFGTLSPEELAEFRQLLQPEVAKLAATRRTQEDVEILRLNIDCCLKALKEGHGDLEKQVEFHLLLANACHNRLISAVIDAVTKVFVDIAESWHLTSRDFRVDLHYNKMLYDCLVREDKEKAGEWMFSHFEESKRLIKRSKRKVKPTGG